MPANHMGDKPPTPTIRNQPVHDPDFTILRQLDGHVPATESDDYGDCDPANPHTP